MTLNKWQQNFLRRLIVLGGSTSVPVGIVNEDLIGLIEANYVREGSGGASQTKYEITKAGLEAVKHYPGR